MRGFVLITGAIALTGCSSEQRAANAGATNINAAAAAAQGDIDTYAANSMEVAAPAATTVPKVAPTEQPDRAAANPAPVASPTGKALGNRQAVLADVSGEPRPCPTQGDANAAGPTRVSARPDDAEFERPGRDAPVQRATASVWQKGDGQALRTGREADQQPVSIGCTVN